MNGKRLTYLVHISSSVSDRVQDTGEYPERTSTRREDGVLGP